MYPLYWTTSKGGIFMRYSYEFKRKAIELFYQGEWPETPTGVLTHTFHEQIIKWAKQEEFNGSEINKHNPDKRCWSPEKKYELVCQVLFGESIRSVSIRLGLELILANCINGFINTKLWDTMVLLINLKDDHQRIAK